MIVWLGRPWNLISECRLDSCFLIILTCGRRRAPDPDQPYPMFTIAVRQAPFSSHDAPVEILLEILSYLNIASLLNLSSTSKAIQAYLSAPVNRVLKARIQGGCLRWILPVAKIQGEFERYEAAIQMWDSDTLGMIRACFKSESMRNRERLWKI